MAITYHLTIYGRLSGLNEYTASNRTNQFKGAKMKADNEHICKTYIAHQLRGVHIKNPVYISFCWYEKNRRRDCDNIAFAKKFILDALVEDGVLVDDSQKYVTGFEDLFYVDNANPRIEVLIEEMRGGND